VLVLLNFFARLFFVMENDTKNKLELNKEQASSFMKKHGIHHAVLEFDGSGDSGQIESIELIGENKEALEELLLEKVPVWKTVHKCVGQKWTRETESQKLDFSDLLESIAYDCLGSRFGGWEINSGSYGTITIKKDGSGCIEFNERIESTEYSEHNF
jgi:hypothetical protein